MPALPRLDQLLASLGYGTRREVRNMVDRGLVKVNGEVADAFDAKVDPQTVLVKGEPLDAPDGLVAVFHKPVGYVCSHASDEGPTIYDLLPKRWPFRNPTVTSVGRVDKDTSGILLLTDQGKRVQKWPSPKSEMDKVYEVEVDLPLHERIIPVFASGTLLLESENRPCLPAQVEIVGTHQARLTLQEGRYHQVRRMFASQGWHVEILHRSRFGEYLLVDLNEGVWRVLPFKA